MEFSEFKTIPTRVPAALWESLQTICWQQDNKFLEDVSRILNVPAAELKRRVLGTRGVVSAVVSTGGAWFEGTQCPIMIPCGGDMWRRCAEPAENNGHCWAHKKGRGLRYDSPHFAHAEVYTPWRLEGVALWVNSCGTVYNAVGKELKGLHVDLRNGVCSDTRPTPAPWTRAEHDAAANDADSSTHT